METEILRQANILGLSQNVRPQFESLLSETDHGIRQPPSVQATLHQSGARFLNKYDDGNFALLQRTAPRNASDSGNLFRAAKENDYPTYVLIGDDNGDPIDITTTKAAREVALALLAGPEMDEASEGKRRRATKQAP